MAKFHPLRVSVLHKKRGRRSDQKLAKLQDTDHISPEARHDTLSQYS
ncbi:hypothetical protein SAMN06269301_3516 [Geobacter sp. DSM 9736]|nr:hypothetical protein SAMN06269301_3516 [Geobacter sp. DSM 9736]